MYDTVYGSNYGASSKKGREERWDHMESLKTPRLDDLKNKFFFYKLLFHIPEVRISSPKAQKLSLLQRGLYQKMSCIKHLETASTLANRTEPFGYLQFLVEVWI